jgi:hypothetical protein
MFAVKVITVNTTCTFLKLLFHVNTVIESPSSRSVHLVYIVSFPTRFFFPFFLVFFLPSYLYFHIVNFIQTLSGPYGLRKLGNAICADIVALHALFDPIRYLQYGQYIANTHNNRSKARIW